MGVGVSWMAGWLCLAHVALAPVAIGKARGYLLEVGSLYDQRRESDSELMSTNRRVEAIRTAPEGGGAL